MGDFRRCLAFIEALEEQNATTIVPFELGRAFFDRAFPVVWDFNFLRVERAGEWAQLAAAAEEIQGAAGLAHRRMFLRDEDWAGDIVSAARRDGWEAISLAFMIRRAERSASSDVAVRELTYEEIRPLREQLARRRPWATSEEYVQQVLNANKAWSELANARFFGAEVEGTLAAACDLYRGPGVAQIEDVETRAEFQKRGLAGAVVLAAARAAIEDGDDPTLFLVTDENDRPKRLYERLGFETAGRRYALLKTNLDD